MQDQPLPSRPGTGRSQRLSLAHLVNVFVPQPGSEFNWVQPITLETMRRARAATKALADIDLLTAQLPADRAAVPADFRPTTDLDRSVREVWENPALPPFPLVADLLHRLYHESTAEFLVLTNLDIALQPQFYDAVIGFIHAGHDAFIINRRRIPGHYRTTDQLQEMYREMGKPHPGFDCFVFHRSLYPKFRLGNICIGVPFIEITLGQNLFCHARSFHLYEHEHLTFHIGEEVFKKRNTFLLKKNREEFRKCMKDLWPHLDNRKFPYGDRWLLARILKWGLHPCIPIRLALKLEWRRWLTLMT